MMREHASFARAEDFSCLAAAALPKRPSVLPASPLYARIDIVSLNGQWHVMEVEATEPSLWLHLAPDTTRLLADAIAARLSSR